jgi:hypothetical protein
MIQFSNISMISLNSEEYPALSRTQPVGPPLKPLVSSAWNYPTGLIESSWESFFPAGTANPERKTNTILKKITAPSISRFSKMQNKNLA